MIDLGDIHIRNSDSFVETRKKILGLADALQFDAVTATRLATATSEMARILLRSGHEPLIKVKLVAGTGQQGLMLEFAGCTQVKNAMPLLSQFFDQVSSADGNGTVTAFKHFPVSNLELNNYFVRKERERIGRPSRSELMEELRHKNAELERYTTQLEELVAERTAALQKANQKMQNDLDAAARYVRTLLPAPTDTPLRLDWRYLPSANLGGDTFGYHWVDDEHFALYLIDVTGHGLDSALLSVTVLNVLRSEALPHADFRQPGQVLGALNDAFPMDRYGEKMFTIWYGVFNCSTSVLSWSGGGHPDALLFEGKAAVPVHLKSQGPMMGMMPWPEFETDQHTIRPPARLYVYSDGVYEIHKTDGATWTFEEFVAFLSHPPAADVSMMDLLLNHVRQLHGSDQLEDDFSIVEAQL